MRKIATDLSQRIGLSATHVCLPRLLLDILPMRRRVAYLGRVDQELDDPLRDLDVSARHTRDEIATERVLGPRRPSWGSIRTHGLSGATSDERLAKTAP